jgi:hypothetical protein
MLVMQTKRRRTILFMNALMEVETIAAPAAPKGPQRIDLDELDRALDGLGCPAERGLLRRLLDRLGR